MSPARISRWAGRTQWHRGGSTLLVLTTLGSAAQGKRFARRILKERLAACVNLIPAVHSIYRWKGRVEEAGEVLLLIKTDRAQLEPLRRIFQNHHPYDLPELIALPITLAEKRFLRWLQEQIRKPLTRGALKGMIFQRCRP